MCYTVLHGGKRHYRNAVTGCYRVLHCVTECHIELQGVAWC